MLTIGTRELLASAQQVVLRTRHHPTVAELDPAGRWSDCDDIYATGASFDEVYASVVDRLFEASRSSAVVYAVPGHPLVAERTVSMLIERGAAEGVIVRIHPAVSFVDAAAVALGVDQAGVQICDAFDLRIDAQRPAIVGQVFDRDATTALKLRLLDIYPADFEVTILGALGTQAESKQVVPLSELDHRPFGYTDCLYLPALEAVADVRRFDGLYAVIQRLHGPGGCPWDREQTHESLRPHLLEESYEALEAIDAGNLEGLAEELGDVLLQVLMHAAVAERLDEFTFADVTESIARKLIRRHPHVFGEATVASAEEVYTNWEALKKAERPATSVLEGVPKTLPALAASQSIQGRARRVGFDWPDIEGPLEKLIEEVAEFARAGSSDEREDEFGDILFVLANIGQRLGVDAEQALRQANEKFRRRFAAVESLAAEAQVDLKDLDLAGLDALWERAKEREQRRGAGKIQL